MALVIFVRDIDILREVEGAAQNPLGLGEVIQQRGDAPFHQRVSLGPRKRESLVNKKMFPEMVDQPCSDCQLAQFGSPDPEVTDRIGHAHMSEFRMTSPTSAIIEGPRSDGSCVSDCL